MLKCTYRDNGRTKELFVDGSKEIHTENQAVRYWCSVSPMDQDHHSGTWEGDGYYHLEFYHKEEYVGAIWRE